MYDRHLQEMARGLVEALLSYRRAEVEFVLKKYWTDKIAVVWTTEDVHGIQDDFDVETGKSPLEVMNKR